LGLHDDHRYAVWTAEWKGGLRTDVSGRGHHLRSDEPPEFGGTDTGPMPTELLCAALAACFCLAVAWAAGKRRIELEYLEVQVQPHRALGEPRHGSYDVWVHSSAAAEAIAPVVDLAKRYCWVTNTLMHPPEIRYHLGAAGTA
jgi:putative redox protein